MDERKPPWISVQDDLPEDGQRVLVCTTSRLVKDARYSKRRNCFVASGRINVTHWMPQPMLPEEEN